MYKIDAYFRQSTERLLFRALNKADIIAWEAFFKNNPNLRFVAVDESKPINLLAEEWINRQIERYEEDGSGLLAIIEKKNNQFVGVSGLLSRNLNGKKEIEIAYSLIPEFWGKGYATEAARQLHQFGITHQLAKHFISIIHQDNLPSMKVAVKNNMQPIQETEFMNMPVIIYQTKKNT